MGRGVSRAVNHGTSANSSSHAEFSFLVEGLDGRGGYNRSWEPVAISLQLVLGKTTFFEGAG